MKLKNTGVLVRTKKQWENTVKKLFAIGFEWEAGQGKETNPQWFNKSVGSAIILWPDHQGKVGRNKMAFQTTPEYQENYISREGMSTVDYSGFLKMMRGLNKPPKVLLLYRSARSGDFRKDEFVSREDAVKFLQDMDAKQELERESVELYEIRRKLPAKVESRVTI